jgi:hypothetical protein
LGWVCEDAKLQVSKLCKLRFSITSKFIDEVELDVLPLDICGIALGSPYLYDKKTFFCKEYKYHLTKNRVEYIVRSHHEKTNLSLVTTRQMKRLVIANTNCLLMIVKAKDGDKSKAFKRCDPKHKD